MIRILTIIGARPQIIKAAAISRAIRTSFADAISETIVHTGQHYDVNMSAVFMKELSLPAEDYNLQSGSGLHGKQTALMLTGIEEILLKEKPDAVLVYGDTNSTIAGGLAAAKLHIPVIHVEAGLRSFNKSMPEEINRICCDHLSTLLFSPTTTAVKNLQKEGYNVSFRGSYTVDTPGIFHCGDIMYDNSIYYSKMAEEKSGILSRLGLTPGEYILATVHRDSNTDDPEILSALFEAFAHIAGQGQQVVLPLHPRTAKMMELYGIVPGEGILITAPASFLDITALESNCSMVMTDSGGVQKEAYFFSKPCLILREETEWVELVEQGCALLTGTTPEKIIGGFHHFLNKKLQFPAIFGDGHAATFICQTIVDTFKPSFSKK